MTMQATTDVPGGFTFGEIKISRNHCADGSYWVAVCYRGVTYIIGQSSLGLHCPHDSQGRSYYRAEQIRAVRMMSQNGYSVPRISSALCLPEHSVRELLRLIRDLVPDSPNV